MVTTAGFGEWRSPITTDLIISDGIGLGGIRRFKGSLYWLESRPQEGGRNVVVTRQSDGTERDLVPAPYNVRSRVHEYGGDAWLLYDDSLYFVNFSDQQLYRVRLDSDVPSQLSHEEGLRFANGIVDGERQRLIYVTEDHRGEGEAVNAICAVHLATGKVTELAGGHDFFAEPTLSPDGRHLAWLSWDHPHMPWDETSLWLAELNTDGTPESPQLIAGGQGQDTAVLQPRFSPDERLHYVSDENGWWNLYCEGQCLHDATVEFGSPHWNFGQCSYQFEDEDHIVCVINDGNQHSLARLETRNGTRTIIDQPMTSIGGIHLQAGVLTYVGAAPDRDSAALILDLEKLSYQTVKESTTSRVSKDYLSEPKSIRFPSASGDPAHAFYYPPRNIDYVAPAGELPPLIVFMHGGPTASTSNALSLRTQFWTSRGFAILDINYRGSSGYGREYRNKLRGQWGVVDVEDTVFGARYLVEQGLVDPNKLAIRGGSAGGYTTLAALAFQNTFQAGASHYGIGDLETLARDTHKFESRYLDSMIGRYPEDIAVYKARSPINHVDQLSAAVIFFQGLEDQVVPPNQAEAMVDALKTKGMPVAYVPFEGEQHGFRRAENIKRALELELFFYGRVFSFTPADDIEPVHISNLDPESPP